MSFISYKCELCGNTDQKYIGYLHGKPYCRRCISFSGEEVNEVETSFDIKSSNAYVKYSLSKEQSEISSKVIDNFKNGINTLIHAVCGAGKTELVFGVIEYALKHRLKVGFAIPRRDVVIELAIRLQTVFKNNIVSTIYGGNTKILNGDILCLTTHQLYRYPSFFDLLVLDEIDAFPSHHNEVLHALFKRSVKGNYVLMSATPDKETLKEFSQNHYQILTLFTRYHKHPMPVPVVKFRILFSKILFVIRKLKEYQTKKKPCLVFVPTIDECEYYFKIINLFCKNGSFVHSKRLERPNIIESFRKGIYKFLITTAVLERGVTLRNLQVIILNSDSSIYNSSALIQISGRVGRVIGAEDGDVFFVCEKKTKEMEIAVDFIKKANQSLQSVL